MVEETVKEEMEEVEGNVVSSVEDKAILQDFAKAQGKMTGMVISQKDQMVEEIERILKVPLKNKETEKEALQVLNPKRSVTKKENAQIQNQSASTKKETTEIARERSLQVAAEINVRAGKTKGVEVQN